MIRTQIQLTEGQFRRLKRLSAERGISLAGLIREALDRHMDGQDPTALRARAANSIGGFRSGMVDVSNEHDRYFAENK